MREYIISLGSVMLLTAFMQMLLPEGNIKKFASLAAGFMIISSIITPVKLDFNFLPSFDIQSPSSAEGEAVYRAEVIKRHKENIRSAIEKQMKHGGRAFVETDNEGNITSVTLWCRGDESGAVIYITESLGVKRERIKIYDDN